MIRFVQSLYMFNAQQLTCDRTSHIKVAPDLLARGMGGESTIPHRLSAIKSWKVFRLPSSARGGVYKHRFFFYQKTFSPFFKTAARTTRIIVHSLTVRTFLSVRYVHARTRVCVRARGMNLCHTHTYRVSRGTLRRAASTFLYGIACEQVRLRNDRRGNNTGAGRCVCGAYVSRNELLQLDSFFVSHVKMVLSSRVLSSAYIVE